MESVAELIKLIRDVEEITIGLDDPNIELYQRVFPKLSEALAIINLHIQIEGVQQELNDDTMTSLRFLAGSLSTKSFENAIDGDSLELIRVKVEKLIRSAENTDLPKDLRKILIAHLTEIHRAITMYKVTGSGGLKKATERNIGFYATYFDELQKESKFRIYLQKNHLPLITLVFETLNISAQVLLASGGNIAGLLGSGG